MRARTVLQAAVLFASSAVLAGAARAQEAERYLLEARAVPGEQEARVELTLRGEGEGLRATRRVLHDDGRAGPALRGSGQRLGPIVTVRFPRARGVTGALADEEDPPALRARYVVTDDGRKIRGVISDPVAEDWRLTYEEGRRVAAFPEEAELERVVLCVDGVPYEVLRDLRGEGHFAGFTPPARMVSVFPSLSSPSWETVLDLPRSAGYQVLYYSRGLEDVTGSTSGEMLHSYFETRMHHSSHGVVGHSLTYVLPLRVGGPDMRDVLREVEEHQGSRTAFVYLFQTDAIAHMNGREDLEQALLIVEEELERLMESHRERTGRELEVAFLSDHGNTLTEGELVPLKDHLEDDGWEVGSAVEDAQDVTYTSAGILGAVALYCREEREAALARAASRLEGVDVCTFDRYGELQHVVSAEGEARFRYDPEADAYRHEVLRGEDPLGYTAVYEELAAAGKLDARGYARSEDLFEATKHHPYPDAPERIRVGHTTLVHNPANVLVSLRAGFENGMGTVKAVAGVRGRDGTHGGLARADASGVLMTNFLPARDAVRAVDVRSLIDLSAYHANDPALELQVVPAAPGEDEDTPPRALELRVNDPYGEGARRTTLEVSVRRNRLFRDRLVWRETFAASELDRFAGTLTVSLDGARAALEPGKKHTVRVLVRARDAEGAALPERELELSFENAGTFQNLVAD